MTADGVRFPQDSVGGGVRVSLWIGGHIVLATGFDAGHGRPDAAAGKLYTQRLLTLAAPDRFPHLHRTLTAGALADETDFTTEEFEFGLHTLLDGIETLINHRSAGLHRCTEPPPRAAPGTGSAGLR